MNRISKPRRREIIAALRNGTVPRHGLEHYAVGLDRFEKTIEQELSDAALGTAHFKAVRGDYGAGKTFFIRWARNLAHQQGFATAEVQISETDTPLYRMETIYRRAIENLSTKEWTDGAFRSLVDRWFFSLEEEVSSRAGFDARDERGMAEGVGELLEARLAQVSAKNPQFAAVLRVCHRARVERDAATAEGLLAWLMGQPNVGADIKRAAGIKGELDHFGAGTFFRGLLELLRQTGRKGLLLSLDEVETVQRMRGDVRDKSLNGLRRLIDEIDRGDYPGMYLLITGTTAFYEGPMGIKKLAPLDQRLRVDFDTGFESTKAVQIRLSQFDPQRLEEVGRKVRDLYDADNPERIAQRASDAFIAALALQVTGKLGGKVGIAPRLFLRKLVQVLDLIDEHEGFDPAAHYKLDLSGADMRPEEAEAAGLERSVDDIELDLGGQGQGEPEA